MTKRWPRISASVTRTIKASHSLPRLGTPAAHEHEYKIACGWKHEINPTFGYTETFDAMREKSDMAIDAVLSKFDGKNLNEVLPQTPTAEWLALNILEALPSYWFFVEIECYDGYRVRADR